MGAPQTSSVPADYDRSVTDIACPGHLPGWYARRSSNNFFDYSVHVGMAGDVPMPGDYDGDGKADPRCIGRRRAVVRAGEHRLHHVRGVQWGVSGDIPVQTDYDGDRKTDIAVYRPSTGAWYILMSTTGFASGATYTWGTPDDVPAPGDYDGDGKADLGIYRPSTGEWVILRSDSGYTTWDTYQWGAAGDVAILGRQ